MTASFSMPNERHRSDSAGQSCFQMIDKFSDLQGQVLLLRVDGVYAPDFSKTELCRINCSVHRKCFRSERPWETRKTQPIFCGP